MTTKASGAELLAFWKDDDPNFWPEGASTEDEIITIDGREYLNGFDESEVEPDSVVTITGGMIVGFPGEPSFEAHFKRWRKAQQTTRIVVEVDKIKANELVNIIRLAGGRVLTS